jgi:putative membrane protein
MLTGLARILVLLVAAIQFGIAVVEIFLWPRDRVHRRLGYSREEAKRVAPIVMNAGLYNGFLATGLAWSAVVCVAGPQIAIFCLTCVVVAGVFGAITLKWTTLVLQTLPGLVALLAVWRAG